MMTEVTIVDVQPQTVIGVRQRGRYEEIATMLAGLYMFAMGRGIEIAGRPVFVCHEATPEDAMKAAQDGDADIEVALPVSLDADGCESVKHYQLPGGRMAKIVHKGPYQGSLSAYEKLYTWLGCQGKKPTGPVREVYVNDPRDIPPEEILTEIYAPIE